MFRSKDKNLKDLLASAGLTLPDGLYQAIKECIAEENLSLVYSMDGVQIIKEKSPGLNWYYLSKNGINILKLDFDDDGWWSLDFNPYYNDPDSEEYWMEVADSDDEYLEDEMS